MEDYFEGINRFKLHFRAGISCIANGAQSREKEKENAILPYVYFPNARSYRLLRAIGGSYDVCIAQP